MPGYRTVRPCSIGLTFTADVDARVLVSLDTTARYEPVVSSETENDRPARFWRRKPLNYRYEIKPGDPGVWREHEFLGPDGEPVHDSELQLHFKRRVDGAQQTITVTLINKASESDDRERDEVCLFQAGLAVEAAGTPTAAVRSGRVRNSHLRVRDEDAQSAALLYRDVVEYAVGHGVAAVWEPSPGACVDRDRDQLDAACPREGYERGRPRRCICGLPPQNIRTRFGPSGLPGLDARTEVISVLSEFVAEYRRWIDESLEARLSDIPTDLSAAAHRNLAHCRDACRRMEDGVSILETSDRRVAGIRSRQCRDGSAGSQYEAKGDRRGPLTWRPFQLAYLLLVLPGLVGPEYSDRDCLDLLWFPTGGGKTEAYLCLTAFQIFLRRLTDANRRDTGGVDVLMRYTLRLLTIQQFQRAASLICACDAIRRGSA